MPSTLADVFGARPDRPDHPDFWMLSEIILELKAKMADTRHDKETQEAAWRASYEAIGDFDSIIYCAIQAATQTMPGMYPGMTHREFRARLVADPALHRSYVQAVQTYMDGFIMGAKFVQRKGESR